MQTVEPLTGLGRGVWRQDGVSCVVHLLTART
jgi:hypothetical protein